VTWTADSVASADHDIKSVDDDGGDLWIEVKSTTGRDGQFSWPAAEFQLAVRARGRYVLYRVYEADTTAPFYVPSEIRSAFSTPENSGSISIASKETSGPWARLHGQVNAAAAAPGADGCHRQDARPSSQPAGRGTVRAQQRPAP
jgi:hypothetical protein